jgi:hypothetical protein
MILRKLVKCVSLTYAKGRCAVSVTYRSHKIAEVDADLALVYCRCSYIIFTEVILQYLAFVCSIFQIQWGPSGICSSA